MLINSPTLVKCLYVSGVLPISQLHCNLSGGFCSLRPMYKTQLPKIHFADTAYLLVMLVELTMDIHDEDVRGPLLPFIQFIPTEICWITATLDT